MTTTNTAKLKAIITIGVSGSGKSTWAKNFVANDPENWVIVCRDDIRAAFLGGTLDWSKWNWKNEDKVTINHCLALRQARDANKNVIVADTNLNHKFNNELQARLRALGYDVELKVFNVAEEIASLRDKARGSLAVGPAVIKKQMVSFHTLKELGCYGII